MFKAIRAAVMAALLVSCTPESEPYIDNTAGVEIIQPSGPGRVGPDDYVFLRKQWEHTDLHIKVVYHRSLKDLQKSYHEYTGEPVIQKGLEVKAYTISNPGTNLCEIHLLDPAVGYFPEFTGHEFYHCINGDFHGDDGIVQ